MKKVLFTLFTLIALLVSLTPAHAQVARMNLRAAVAAAPEPQGGGGHTVTLTYNASSDAAANPTLTYNAYRALTCTGTFAKVNATAIAGTTFTDTGVQPGNWCYQVKASLNGVESVPSNNATAVILPAAPTGLAASGS